MYKRQVQSLVNVYNNLIQLSYRYDSTQEADKLRRDFTLSPLFKTSLAAGKTQTGMEKPTVLLYLLIVSGVTDYIDDKQQKQIQAEKERLQKEAISTQAALIQALRDDAQMSRERQDYLECLNQQLQKALEDFQREAVQDEQV